MPERQRVVARLHGPSGDNFPTLAEAVLSLIFDGDITPQEGIKMMETIIYCSVVYDPEGWYPPARELALHPVVFEAMQNVTLKIMEEEAEEAAKAS